MPDNTLLWHVPRSTKLLWRCWDEEFIVYNAASGQTHYLNMLAARVLQYFQAQSASLATLIDDIEIGGAVASDGAQSLLAQVRELVKELDSLGLIAPVVP